MQCLSFYVWLIIHHDALQFHAHCHKQQDFIHSMAEDQSITYMYLIFFTHSSVNEPCLGHYQSCCKKHGNSSRVGKFFGMEVVTHRQGIQQHPWLLPTMPATLSIYPPLLSLLMHFLEQNHPGLRIILKLKAVEVAAEALILLVWQPWARPWPF